MNPTTVSACCGAEITEFTNYYDWDSKKYKCNKCGEMTTPTNPPTETVSDNKNKEVL